MIETLSGRDGGYSEEGFLEAIGIENKQVINSLSLGAFFQKVDTLAQRVLNPDE